MKYILLVIMLFFSPVIVMFCNVLITKLISPKVSQKTNRLTLMPIPKNVAVMSLLIDLAFTLFVLNKLNLSQLLISLLIILCVISVSVAIFGFSVILLDENDGFIKKSSKINEDDMKIHVSLEYEIEEDTNGKLNDLGILQISVSNGKKLYSNLFRMDKNKELMRFIKPLHLYKNIKYSVHAKEFDNFDDAFIYIVKLSIENNKFVDKYMDEFEYLYKLANPNGDFKSLKLSNNYK